MSDKLTRYRDALVTIRIMLERDAQCPSCGHPNGLPAILGVVERALSDG